MVHVKTLNKAEHLSLESRCVIFRTGMGFAVNIDSRMQSGNHIAFSTIYVFEHIEASQTKRRDNIYVVIKVW